MAPIEYVGPKGQRNCCNSRRWPRPINPEPRMDMRGSIIWSRFRLERQASHRRRRREGLIVCSAICVSSLSVSPSSSSVCCRVLAHRSGPGAGQRCGPCRSRPFHNARPVGRRRSGRHRAHGRVALGGYHFRSFADQALHRLAGFPLRLFAEAVENLLEPAGMAAGLLQVMFESWVQSCDVAASAILGSASVMRISASYRSSN